MTAVMKQQQVWLGGYDISGVMNALGLDYGVQTNDGTTVADDTVVNSAGLFQVTAQHEGLDEKSKIFWNKIGVSDEPMSFAPKVAASPGDMAYTMRCMQAEYSPGGSVGDRLSFSVSAQSRGKLIRGTLMENREGVSSDGTGTARELGSVGSDQYVYASLHVLSVSGSSPTLEVDIVSDSANDFSGSETIRLSSSQFTAIGSEWLTQAGSISDTWWRVEWVVGGTNVSFDFVVIVGIQ